MTDPRFFQLAQSVSLADIASLTGAQLVRAEDSRWSAAGLASLEDAGPGDVTFCAGERHGAALRSTRAGACLVREADIARSPNATALLVTTTPASAFARLAAILYPDAVRAAGTSTSGISIGATIDATARLEVGASIAAGVVIGRGVEIGAGTTVGPYVVLGDGVRIGRDCHIGPHVTISHAFIGDRVIIHTGARLGQDGFGFVPGARRHAKIAQLGRVIVQDDVEIGANTAVDRGALDDTIIGEGTKIDNLVQIAHNVVVGRNCLIAGQVGVAGSAHIGDGVFIGGQAGIGGHLTIGDGAQIAGKSGVVRDVPARARLGGSPAGPVGAWLRQAVRGRRVTSRS